MPVDDLDAAKKNRERIAALQAREQTHTPLERWRTPSFNSANPVRYVTTSAPDKPELLTKPPDPPQRQRRGVVHPVHYAKTKEVLAEVDKALASGASIRQCSRELGVAINTVRKHVKTEIQIDVTHQKEELHWLLFALKGVAIAMKNETTEDVFDKSIKLLHKFLKGNPQRTIKELIPETEHGATFSADDLIKKTMEYVTKSYLDYHSDEFEKVGEDTYRLKTETATSR